MPRSTAANTRFFKWMKWIAPACIALWCSAVHAGDWPQWRYDAARSAASPDELPAKLHLQWIRELPTPRPAWPASQPSLRFDVSYSPVAAGKMLFVPSMVTDTVTAYDTDTGEERWRFYTDGPIRFAPIVDKGKVYTASDDGHLYCLDAKQGSQLWRFRAAPKERLILGNERLISTWPVRGGPVLHEGTIYITAGVWPFMGIFACAVNAETGQPVWTNSTLGSTYQTHPHGAPSFGGLVPRGHLAVTEGGLVAPGGRTGPGTFDLKTGQLKSFTFGGKGAGRTRHGPVPIKAGSRTFTPGADQITATGGWFADVEGKVWTMLAADDKLFVVTTTGRIYCFGGKETSKVKTHSYNPTRKSDVPWSATGGYDVVLGLGDSKEVDLFVTKDLVERLIVVDRDPKKIDAFRRRMTEAGLYGVRASAHVGDPAAFPLPPYLANMITVDDLKGADPERVKQVIQKAFQSLRPYGGKAVLPISSKDLEKMVTEAEFAGAKVKGIGDRASLLTREGPLPGAADWTHNYADAGNSVVSKDKLAKAPLGLLWFGNGPPNDEVLPRHGHGPSPQVAAGRLFIEGADMIRGIDIYTGRFLWQRSLPGLGRFYNNTGHQPGAGEIGSNYVSMADSVCVVYGENILRLDAATGKTIKEFTLPPDDQGKPPTWGYVGAWEDLLIATSTPVRPEGSGKATAAASRKPVVKPGMTPLIKPHDAWQYTAADPTGDWTAIDFDTKKWKTGAAGFGYGDGDDKTVVGGSGRLPRVYVRKTFDGKTAQKATAMTLVINYDDGFIAYFNGKEIARSHVGRGAGPQAAKVTSHEADGYEAFAIREFGKLLLPGKNVVAIEGHNVSRPSSDFSLDPYLLIESDGGKQAVAPEPKPEPAGGLGPFTSATYSSASKHLVVMDRQSGKVLWTRAAKYNFRHNNIAVAAGKVFCIDGLSYGKQQELKRRGLTADNFKPRLLALDARTGKEIWSTGEDVFGTFLSYSAEHDILLQSGSAYRDRARDESHTGMVAYGGKDGSVLWKNLQLRAAGPCLLHGDSIIPQGPALSILTGKPKTRKHPLSGEPIPWQFTRNYGCNTAIASENLITFRSGAAGFFDLAGDGGTGNIGGFKSSCTSNLIIAGGLVNAPEYTRTCGCNYQNQTSLALIHDPDAELWTFNSFSWDGKPVKQVGVNFGAPGDRRAAGGTLWMDVPSVGGASPNIPVTVQPKNVGFFRNHASLIRADADSGQLAWVAASGALGVTEVSLTLAKEAGRARNYTVRLHFAEVENLKPGRRVFSIALQGKEVLKDFDIAKDAGGVGRAVMKQFSDVKVADKLMITFTPRSEKPPILCGIEVVAE